MTSTRSRRQDRQAKALRTQQAGLEPQPNPEPACIEVDRSGEWMPAEELVEAAQAALAAGNGVRVHLGALDHLDASALQILLALGAEQKRRGKPLQLANASGSLRRWFELAGAAEDFFADGADRS